jgi:hypothetical protein
MARSGSCLQERSTPGCDNESCQAVVCQSRPDCCTVAWDANCVVEAEIFCEGCGITQDSCFLPHVKPGCADQACCETVCAQDDYCCSVEWDDTCSLLAQINCDPTDPVACGDPAAGDCFVARPTPSCDAADCCDQVCAVWDPCCSSAWDNFCVSLATSLCQTTCQPGCPTGSVQETENCGARSNDPVFRPGTATGTPQAIAANTNICGEIFRPEDPTTFNDVDVYLLDLRNADTDGDGQVKLRVILNSASPLFAAVVPDNAAGSVLPAGARLTVNATGCGTSKDWTCLEPAQWWVVVAQGTDGVISSTAMDCQQGAYLLRTEVQASCFEPCGADVGSCFEPHALPGCVDAACCSATCALVPECCDTGWDEFCALTAADTCGAPAPANDTCGAATEVTEGAWSLTTIGATPDGPSVPASCRVSSADSKADVWFRWSPARGGECQLDVCDASWDSRIEVFRGGCGNLELAACRDDSPFCTRAKATRLNFTATCGVDYLIRVSGVGQSRGVATLTISMPDGPDCCPADLDGNASVDAGDIGSLLLLFGQTGGAGDLDGSGQVDAGDIGVLLVAFGPCP